MKDEKIHCSRVNLLTVIPQFFVSQDLMLKAMKTKEIKFTSSSVWEKRENPHEYWNGKE